MKEFNQTDLTPLIKKTKNPRIGVVTLSTDFTIEQDYRKICHALPVDIFVNRIPFINPLNQKNYRNGVLQKKGVQSRCQSSIGLYGNS